MSKEIQLKDYWPFNAITSLLPSTSDFQKWIQNSDHSGVSVSEDDKHIYIEAALPGLEPENIEMHVENGALLIKGERKEETSDKSKKFYRKAHSNFFYNLPIPGAVVEDKHPEAIFKNGILKVTFQKSKKTASKKKIPIKKGK